jgi:hypothetical protein
VSILTRGHDRSTGYAGCVGLITANRARAARTSLRITDSSFVDNQGESGVGVRVNVWSPTEVIIERTEFLGNHALWYDPVLNWTAYADVPTLVRLDQVIVADNQAETYPGLRFGAFVGITTNPRIELIDTAIVRNAEPALPINGNGALVFSRMSSRNYLTNVDFGSGANNNINVVDIEGCTPDYGAGTTGMYQSMPRICP